MCKGYTVSTLAYANGFSPPGRARVEPRAELGLARSPIPAGPPSLIHAQLFSTVVSYFPSFFALFLRPYSLPLLHFHSFFVSFLFVVFFSLARLFSSASTAGRTFFASSHFFSFCFETSLLLHPTTLFPLFSPSVPPHPRWLIFLMILFPTAHAPRHILQL